MMNIYGEFTTEEIGVIKKFKEFLENWIFINAPSFKVAVSKFATEFKSMPVGGQPVLAGGFLSRLLYCYNKRLAGDLLPEERKYLSGGDMDIFINGLALNSATPDSDRVLILNQFYYMFLRHFEFKSTSPTDPYEVRNPNIIEIGVNSDDILYSMPDMGLSESIWYRTQFYFPKLKGVQIIFTKYVDRDACIGHFDYEHLKISYCLLTNTLKLSPLAFRCATRKLLMPNQNQAPSEWRRKKFLDMGFTENDLQPKLL